jgi:hypothetical protein
MPVAMQNYLGYNMVNNAKIMDVQSQKDPHYPQKVIVKSNSISLHYQPAVLDVAAKPTIQNLRALRFI